ncbi:hypothetical protein O988_02654 [Pseudogymnoascus sp. VKM F-3808]|nr:hypothetical protein O988_02654 [Pseudogymnoascus sp. VKM F-3808]
MSATCIKKTCLLAFLLFNLSVPAVALPAISLRQAAPGTQFITGACTTDADCAPACCGFKSGKCAGPIVAQERDGGCGFGDAQPNDTAAVALTGGAPANNGNAATGQAASTGAASGQAAAAGGTSAAPAAGSQFITGACTSDADCASACCGFNSGKCAGPVVAQERDGGCGFGDAQPNDTAAQALTGGASANVNASAGQVASAGDADCASACCGFNSGKCAGPVVAQERDGGCGFGDAQPNDTAAQALTGGTSANGNAATGQAAASGAGAGTSAAPAAGSQFITGACTSDADCASACCGFNSGKCAGPVVAQERDGGCGFGDAQPNDTAAQALTGGASANVNASAGQVASAGTSAAPAAGSQFITGACTSDADCASACCGFNSGKCAGPVVAQERDGGCGFGDAQPNDTAAKALTGQ